MQRILKELLWSSHHVYHLVSSNIGLLCLFCCILISYSPRFIVLQHFAVLDFIDRTMVCELWLEWKSRIVFRSMCGWDHEPQRWRSKGEGRIVSVTSSHQSSDSQTRSRRPDVEYGITDLVWLVCGKRSETEWESCLILRLPLQVDSVYQVTHNYESSLQLISTQEKWPKKLFVKNRISFKRRFLTCLVQTMSFLSVVVSDDV